MWRRSVLLSVPWGSWLGLARSLLAVGTICAIAFTDVDALFAPVLGRGDAPYCQGPTSIGLFCLVDRDQLEIVRWVCVAVLVIVAGGWRPRLTAIPHWWVSFSVSTGLPIPDGGEHVNQVLTLLLVPVLLADSRRWHWRRPSPTTRFPVLGVAVAAVVLVVIRVQVAGIYFQSSVAKLSHAEWADGTGMYYWFNHQSFGVPPWMRPLADWMVDQPVLLAGLTWTPLAIEFALAISILLRPAYRWFLLPAGVALHLCIAMTMGLWSFAVTMMGAIVLLLVPPGTHLRDTRDTVAAFVAARRGPRRRTVEDARSAEKALV